MIRWLQRFWPTLFIFLLAILFWEAAVKWFQIESWILPSPSAVVLELGNRFSDLQMHIFSTLRIGLIGLFFGVIIGILFASLFHLIPVLRRAFYPFILLSQNIPMIALAPLLVVWFGFGDFPKLIVVVLICFFPITVATLDGFAQTDPLLQIYMKISGATRWQRFIKCEWPSALPSFFSGLKLSATYSIMGAVIAEWLGAEKGLGKMMTLASKAYATERLFVAILMVVILSLAMFLVITFVEKIVLAKREGRNEETCNF